MTGLQPGALLISPSSLQTRGFKSLGVAQNFRTPPVMLRETFCTPILLKPVLEVVQDERECSNIVHRRRRPHSRLLVWYRRRSIIKCHGAFALYCHIGQRHLRRCLKAGGQNWTRSNEELM